MMRPDFWDNVKKTPGDGCWEWQAARKGPGYGTFRKTKGGPPFNAHRVAYELANGPIPPGMHVCHRCDNPPCCNPAHLFVGTAVDNARDRVAKGRFIGEQSPTPKLREADVAEILVTYARGGITMKELGARYGVTWGTVRFIVAGMTWKHVPGPRLSAEEREAIGSANLAAVLRERNTSRAVFKRPRIASNDAQKDVA
jgi:hypothetical protein